MVKLDTCNLDQKIDIHTFAPLHPRQTTPHIASRRGSFAVSCVLLDSAYLAALSCTTLVSASTLWGRGGIGPIALAGAAATAPPCMLNWKPTIARTRSGGLSSIHVPDCHLATAPSRAGPTTFEYLPSIEDVDIDSDPELAMGVQFAQHTGRRHLWAKFAFRLVDRSALSRLIDARQPI